MHAALYCPKCSGDMVPLRRSGVVIDRCADCADVFLDRGELDKIIAAERRWDDDDVFERGDERHDQERGRRKSRRRNFLEELFDID
ncbi:MAG TPA: zf-TFIIB domain-containing protein [Thermomicrobiales bacterium]|nr:zf-TFIIB domain-containing protein [Thermomicrobiales bacterium]